MEEVQIDPGGQQVGKAFVLFAGALPENINTMRFKCTFSSTKSIWWKCFNAIYIVIIIPGYWWFKGVGGNQISFVLLRLELCHKKKIHYIVEQPVSSLLFRYKPMKLLLKRHGARCVTCVLGAFGAPTVKPVPWLKFISTTLFVDFQKKSKIPFCDSIIPPCKIKVVLWGTAPFLPQLGRRASGFKRLVNWPTLFILRPDHHCFSRL